MSLFRTRHFDMHFTNFFPSTSPTESSSPSIKCMFRKRTFFNFQAGRTPNGVFCNLMLPGFLNHNLCSSPIHVFVEATFNTSKDCVKGFKTLSRHENLKSEPIRRTQSPSISSSPHWKLPTKQSSIWNIINTLNLYASHTMTHCCHLNWQPVLKFH